MATKDEAKQNRTSSRRAFTRKRKELIKTMEERDETEIITTRFEECKSLWKSVQENHEAYINLLDESDEVMDAEEAWLEEVQNAFLEVERSKIRYLKEEQLKVEQKRYEEDQRNKEEQHIKKIEQEEKQRQIEKQKRDIEGTTFMQMIESIKELLKTEEEKESPLTSVIKDARNDIKKQLEKCKSAHTLYLTMLDEEISDLELEWIGKYQGIYMEVCKLAGEIIQRCTTDKREQDPTDPKQTTRLRSERMKMQILKETYVTILDSKQILQSKWHQNLHHQSQ